MTMMVAKDRPRGVRRLRSGRDVEDRPSDLGAPLGVVVGFVGSDWVVLADRAFDAKGVVSDVGGQRAVGQVDVGVVASVDCDGELGLRDFQIGDPSGGSDRLLAGYEGGRLAAMVREQVVGVDGTGWTGRLDPVRA